MVLPQFNMETVISGIAERRKVAILEMIYDLSKFPSVYPWHVQLETERSNQCVLSFQQQNVKKLYI